MANGRTLVFAHGWATVLRADWIIVLEEGQVAEQGTQNDLVAKGGHYARIARLQFETQMEA